jgi:hypothetical protein
MRVKDVRSSRLANMRKRIANHVDLLVYDLASPLRKTMSNLAYALLAARTERIEKLFFALLGPPIDRGLAG